MISPIDDSPLKVIPVSADSSTSADGERNVAGDTGIKEAQFFAAGLTEEQIKQNAAHSEHRRNERFRDHFEKIAVCILYLVALVFVFFGFTWLWHLATPDTWHWLSEPQIAKLQNLATGGIIASIAAGHMKKRLS